MVDGIDNTLPLVVQWILGLLGLRPQWALAPRRTAVDYRLPCAEWKAPAGAALPLSWEPPTVLRAAAFFPPDSASGLPPTIGAPPRLAWYVPRFH